MLRYKEPAVAWVNESDLYKETPGITQDEINKEKTVYLINDKDADTDDMLERWLKRNYKILFEWELGSWYTDPDVWPKKRGLTLFKSWFDVERHTVLIDQGKGPILDDGI